MLDREVTKPNRAARLFILAAYLGGIVFSSGSAQSANADSPSAPAARPASGALSASAVAQINAMMAEKAARTPAEQKINSNLLYALKQRAGVTMAPGMPDLHTGLAIASDGTIEVKFSANLGPRLLDLFSGLGVKVTQSFPSYHSLYARVTLSQLEALAADKDILFAMPKPAAITHGRPVVPTRAERAARLRAQLQALPGLGGLYGPSSPFGTQVINRSEGDVTHRADLVRSGWGARGAGVKIGVLSDGVNSLSAIQGSGDLPAGVVVLPGQAGTGDEGTAMLEIVHDLAPDAQLYFATAFTSIESFADNIRALRAAGCDVIIDDVLYYVETPFQTGQAPTVTASTNGGVVLEAVNTVTADGALYFSSAGNSGNKDGNTSTTWEGNFASAGATAAPITLTGTLHDFDLGAGVVTFDTLVMSRASIVDLFWSDPLGASTNDYDLYLLSSDGTSILAFSNDVQNGTQDPVELFSSPGTGTGRLVVVKRTGAADRFLHLDVNDSGSLAINTSGNTHGHSAAASANAFSVAATPVLAPFGASAAGPYPSPFGPTNALEVFSSDGPRRYFYNADGSAITPGNFLATGGSVSNKPDITAADGGSTATPGFNPFYGTSAAAPHAGAIAALIKSGNPALTPTQVRNLMTSTAIDIQAPGLDRDSGFGILDALAAVEASGATAKANIVREVYTATTLVGDMDAFIEPNERAGLQVRLSNTGAADATAVSATLSTSSPGVSILVPTVVYPALPTSGSGEGLAPFVFELAQSAACGQSAEFSLTVGYLSAAGAYSQTFDISVPTGQASSTPLVTPYAGAPVPIPDGNATGATISLTVANVNALVSDVNFRIGGTACSTAIGATTVGVAHTWVGDLVFSLTSPSGTRTVLINRMGGNNNSGNNLCQTTLDDQGGFPSIDAATAGGAPFTGTFSPSAPLAAFNRQPGNGVWQLNVKDLVTLDTGTVRAFSLSFNQFDACDAAPVPLVPITITASAGAAQTAGLGAAFAVDLQATVLSAGAIPMPGVPVTFTAPVTGPSVTFPAGNIATTDAAGHVSVPVIANAVTGTYTVGANLEPALASPAVFSLTNTVGSAATISVTGGSGQQADTGAAFGAPLQAKVSDAFGNPLSGVTVTFASPISGPGVVFANAGTSIAALTGVDGVASSGVVTANATAGAITVTANLSPSLAVPARFALQSMATPVPTATSTGVPSATPTAGPTTAPTVTSTSTSVSARAVYLPLVQR